MLKKQQKKRKKKRVMDFFISLPIEPRTLNLPTNSRLNLILPTYFPEVGWEGISLLTHRDGPVYSRYIIL